MAILTFTVRARQRLSLPTLFNTAAPVGLTTDTPLDREFNQTQPGSVIGHIVIPAFGMEGEMETSVLVTVGEGEHYVILGTKPVSGMIQSYTLSLSGVGRTITREFIGDAGMCVYIAFRINRDGSVTALEDGIIAFNSTPVVSSGSGGLWGYGTDLSVAMEELTTTMLQLMMPMIMISLLMQMVQGIMAGMVI
jgi:hypothetical protein